MTDQTNGTPEERAPVALSICGFEFTTDQVGPFTEGLMDAWARLKDEYDLDTAQRRRMVIAQRMQNLQAARVAAAQKAVDSVEKKLEAEYAKPIEKWDSRQIDRLSDKLDDVTTAFVDAQAADADRFSDEAVSLSEEMDLVAGVEEECFLAMAHHIATTVGKPDPLAEWLVRAGEGDYKAAIELVRAGETPFLNRNARRQARTRGTA